MRRAEPPLPPPGAFTSMVLIPRMGPVFSDQDEGEGGKADLRGVPGGGGGGEGAYEEERERPSDIDTAARARKVETSCPRRRSPRTTPSPSRRASGGG